MSDEEAFIVALRNNPRDEVVRMGYADWLRDQDRDDDANAVLKSRTAPPVELTTEQNRVVTQLLRGVEQTPLQTMGGYAGTGKTTVAARLHAAMPNWGVVAFTGKAADMLRRKGMSEASTIHSAIYHTAEVEGELVHTLKSPASIAVRGFLVDEASMVSRAMLEDLQSFGLPIIAIGDHGQLPPVGDDAGLMLNPMYRLETVHRNAGPIAYFAEHLRKGGNPSDWTAGGGVWIGRKRHVPDKTLESADQVICAYNRTRVALNCKIRKLKGFTLPGFDAPDEPMRGDRVICLKNDGVARVFNGQQGRVKKVNRKEASILFQPDHGSAGEEHWIETHPGAWNSEKPPKHSPGTPKGTMIPFDFAYAITAHKSQGDEWDRVLVYEETCDLWEHPRWAYTAASRAKTALVWATN